jgi:hypothetical protein
MANGKAQLHLFDIRRGPKGPEVYRKDTGERVTGQQLRAVLNAYRNEREAKPIYRRIFTKRW